MTDSDSKWETWGPALAFAVVPALTSLLAILLIPEEFQAPRPGVGRSELSRKLSGSQSETNDSPSDDKDSIADAETVDGERNSRPSSRKPRSRGFSPVLEREPTADPPPSMPTPEPSQAPPPVEATPPPVVAEPPSEPAPPAEPSEK